MFHSTMMQADLGHSTAESPAESLPPSQSSRKRKATSAGSRGVATLTPDQLAKKRANDRDAQRAIRERTKQTIENLERRIQELTAQQPYQELQAVIREKDAIQAENTEIRRRLSTVLTLIQPIVGAQGLTGTLLISPLTLKMISNQFRTRLRRPYQCPSRSVPIQQHLPFRCLRERKSATICHCSIGSERGQLSLFHRSYQSESSMANLKRCLRPAKRQSTPRPRTHRKWGASVVQLPTRQRT